MAFTPAELVSKARNRYNANDDDFWSDQSLYQLIYEAQQVLAREALCIEKTFETSTVVDQREYARPTNAIALKRVEYDGQRLIKSSWKEDDRLTFDDTSTDATGTPEYYQEWNESIFLRPIPAEVKTLKVYSYNEPQVVTATSALEVPTEFQSDILFYMLSEMASKEQNYNAANRYERKWLEAVLAAKKWYRRRKRTDEPAQVYDVTYYQENPIPRG